MKNESKIGRVVIKIIDKIVEQSDGLVNKSVSDILSFFYDKGNQVEQTVSFIRDLDSQAELNESTWILGLILLDKATSLSGFKINKTNVFRLVVTAFCIATKLNEEINIPFKLFANSINEGKNELFGLESCFLVLVEYDLRVTSEEFVKYSNLVKDFA